MKKTTRLISAFTCAFFLFSCGKPEDLVVFNEGQELWNKGEYEKAVGKFQIIVDKFPSSEFADESLFLIANIYLYHSSNPNLAIVYLRELINKDPESPMAIQAREKMARAYYEKFGDMSKAYIEYNALLESLKNYEKREEILEKLWEIDIRRKKFDDAKKEIGDFAAKNGRFEKSDKFYYYMGKTNYLAGNIKEALPFYEHLLKDFKESSFLNEAKFDYAVLLEEDGRLQEAMRIWEELSMIDGSDKKYIQGKIDELKNKN